MSTDTEYDSITGKPLPLNAPEGYCVEMFSGSVWLDADGLVTFDYEKRAVFATIEEAQAAREKALRA